MTHRRIVSTIALVFGLVAFDADRATAAVDLPFDAAYTVAESGSTEPISVFDIHGPAPWLYVDLPDGALTSFLAAVYSDWFPEGASSKAFSVSNSSFVVQDKYWFSPAPDVWDAAKVERGRHRRKGASAGADSVPNSTKISSG